MKFRSRKNIFSYLIFAFTAAIIIFACIQEYIEEGFSLSAAPLYIISLIILVFLGGMATTHYIVTPSHIIYKCGFINGKIEINNIHEIVKGKTMHVGFKPALATKGLIIKYNKFDDIYISPETNDAFIEAVLKINPDIKITLP